MLQYSGALSLIGKFVAPFFLISVISAADQTSCIPVTSRLEGWYSFDGPANPTQGVAGFGPDALWFGNPAPVEGRVGGALRFENGSYLEISSPESFEYPTQNFTISG